MQVSHSDVTTAIKDAIVQKNYNMIDDVLDEGVGNLVTVKNKKTPVFAAVESVLLESQPIEQSYKPYVIEMVVDALTNIYKKVDQKLASTDNSDKELLKRLVHASCNHISPTAVTGSGATVRDMLESYAGVDVTKKPADRAYTDLYKLVHRYGLEQKRTVALENIKAKADNERGR